jgi:hypothetical protein
MLKCEACPNVTVAIEGHHVVPLSYGGKDNGLKVPICGNCHTTIHNCIENPELIPPRHLQKYVDVGRLAKARFQAGELEARDRRATTIVDTNDPQVLADLEHVRRLFNTKSRSATLLAALRFAATHAGRVKQ